MDRQSKKTENQEMHKIYQHEDDDKKINQLFIHKSNQK